ncbi:hypothetical protein, partial [Streptosporangium amethystogenes]|uniref:hypothetical protein n=1 Tax=Streptosporangium amethystogenes TaxID=2002 RepID=UPI001B80DD20
VRTSTSSGVAGPWSEWQAATVEVSGTAGNGLGAVPATRGAESWTLASATPWLYAKVSDAGGAKLVLDAEIEHDPAAPGQGTGVIWSGKGATAYASGGNAWVQVPTGKLTDGMKIRWRVRGVTTGGSRRGCMRRSVIPARVARVCGSRLSMTRRRPGRARD